jgi:hypothetical protein
MRILPRETGDGDAQDEGEVKRKEKEKRKGSEEKRRSVQQLAGQPGNTWQRRCLERQNGGKLFHPLLALDGMNSLR